MKNWSARPSIRASSILFSPTPEETSVVRLSDADNKMLNGCEGRLVQEAILLGVPTACGFEELITRVIASGDLVRVADGVITVKRS